MQVLHGTIIVLQHRDEITSRYLSASFQETLGRRKRHGCRFFAIPVFNPAVSSSLVRGRLAIDALDGAVEYLSRSLFTPDAISLADEHRGMTSNLETI